jgi:hypothetical protein
MFNNRRHEPAPVYAPGDRVQLDGSDIATNRVWLDGSDITTNRVWLDGSDITTNRVWLDGSDIATNRVWLDGSDIATNRVWLDGSDITTNRPSSKLSHRHLGPFVVEACVGQGAYRLKLPYQFCHLHPVFPTVKLSPVPPDPIIGRRPVQPPPTTLVDGEEEYEVEAILDS